MACGSSRRSGGRRSRSEGKFKFWGGLACHLLGGGAQLVPTLHAALEKAGVPVLYDTTAYALLHDDARIQGVRVRHRGRSFDLRAKSVVLACGGFESNAEMRARYLGPNWDLAKVRGTRFNQGYGHRMAMDIGAAVAGHWSGAHAVQWDMNAPPFGGSDHRRPVPEAQLSVRRAGERARRAVSG